MADEEGNKSAQTEIADDKTKTVTTPKETKSKKKVAKKKAAKKRVAKKKTAKKSAPAKKKTPLHRAPAAETQEDKPPTADQKAAAVVESEVDATSQPVDDPKPPSGDESHTGPEESSQPAPVAASDIESKELTDEPIVPANGGSGEPPAQEKVRKQVEEKATMSADTSQSQPASSTGKGSMGFWPKAIVWIIIVIAGFMYIRSLAQRDDTATTDQAAAIPEVEQSGAALESVATEASGAEDTKQTGAILVEEKQAQTPEGTVVTEQELVEVQEVTVTNTATTETAPQPEVPATETQAAEAAEPTETAGSTTEQIQPAAAPETAAPAVLEQAPEETTATAAAGQAAEMAAETEPTAATAAGGESKEAEEASSESQQAAAESAPQPMMSPARPAFAERMQRERPQPPARPQFEERFGRDAMRPQPPARPSPEERFGQRPMPRPQPSDAAMAEAADADTAQPEQPAAAAPGPMEPPARPTLTDRMQRERPQPPARPAFEKRFDRNVMRPQSPTSPSLEQRFGQRPMPRPLPSEAADADTAQPEQATEAAPGAMAPPARPAFADRMQRDWPQPMSRRPFPQQPWQGEVAPDRDFYADPRQMDRPGFQPRNWGYGYGYPYPSTPYGGYQNYPRYYPGTEYPSAQFPQ